ncbi:MAG: glycosyltransferase family 39 protein [Euryarchaeota archaeon]
MGKITDIIHKNKVSLIFMALLGLLMLIITYELVSIQSQIGVAYWDIFLYLNNALKMAGMGIGDTLHLSPFLPFLTSLLFRAGYVFELSLFMISGVFYILGAVGMYLLLKIRFNEYESLAGALSYATFTILMAWAVSGALDAPAISLSIWALYFTYQAVKNDSRYYYVAFPVAMLAFLTRYTSGLIIIPMLLLIFFNQPQKEEIKNGVKGIILGVLIYLPFMWYFYRQIGKPFPFISQFSASAAGTATELNPGYNLDLLYYLKNIPQYLSSPAPDNYSQLLWPSQQTPDLLAYVLLGLIITGIIIYIIKIALKTWKTLKTPQNYLKAAGVLVLGLLLIFTYGSISYVYSEVLLILWALSVFYLLRDYKLKYLDLDLMFLTWFFAFFIMHSFHPVKVDRYFITMVPPLAYGVALGIRQISSLIQTKFKNTTWISPAISLVLVLALLLSAVSYMDKMPREDEVVLIEKETANWLTNYDPEFEDRVIAAVRGPAYSWYLKKFVYTRIPGKVSPEVFQELFEEVNPDYYIYTGEGKLTLDGYTIIRQRGNVTVYEKNTLN